MELNYNDLMSRPLRPTFADKYWANPSYYHRQAAYLACAVILVAANLIG